jgi:hypothetical protein
MTSTSLSGALVYLPLTALLAWRTSAACWCAGYLPRADGRRPIAADHSGVHAGDCRAVPAALRRRVQGFIDRRFYRRRVDAARTLAAFAATARDETDLARLTARWRRVDETMQPGVGEAVASRCAE